MRQDHNFMLLNTSEKFHTENRKPHEVPSWVINKGRCKRCHKEYLANKNKSDYIFTFSGKYSNTNVCDFLTHNNMHFGEIPPILSNLTFVESLMIIKISEAIIIQTLKYDALASKGHAVAVPQDMKIFTKLPLLPNKIGILYICPRVMYERAREVNIGKSSRNLPHADRILVITLKSQAPSTDRISKVAE